MKKVGILGGTFNPPHLGHLIMASEALYAAELDEVRFMPNYIAPHKEVAGASATERLAMTKLAVSNHAQFKVEDLEIKNGGVSYSFDTLTKLSEREPDVEFYFIIGGDMVEGLSSWYRIDELVELVCFIGVQRPGYNAQTTYPVMMIDSPELSLSSTMLRERAATNHPLTYLVPEKVEAFIRKERLYGSQPNA
ncbi:nicotinate-nucleotide adenylyltransferase [Planococcus versutus]|uniref:Probable nicotinate-nucleotide adenylyltransferase n=1 Tax=Planococcus versutus TaxID=1302659 RepID=A0A1B1RXB8_9BACL|nr:nicotinate-nucleotide adenylyltransferase [Planococcus versutus]ANU25585.1 nicotinate (nicotinamide) nucleotide adenylyltransferase [Planococcus versutus]